MTPRFVLLSLVGHRRNHWAFELFDQTQQLIGLINGLASERPRFFQVRHTRAEDC